MIYVTERSMRVLRDQVEEILDSDDQTPDQSREILTLFLGFLEDHGIEVRSLDRDDHPATYEPPATVKQGFVDGFVESMAPEGRPVVPRPANWSRDIEKRKELGG